MHASFSMFFKGQQRLTVSPPSLCLPCPPCLCFCCRLSRLSSILTFSFRSSQSVSRSVVTTHSNAAQRIASSHIWSPSDGSSPHSLLFLLSTLFLVRFLSLPCCVRFLPCRVLLVTTTIINHITLIAPSFPRHGRDPRPTISHDPHAASSGSHVTEIA